MHDRTSGAVFNRSGPPRFRGAGSLRSARRAWRDLARPAEAARVVESAIVAFGGIDILVNNAGGTDEGVKPWLDASVAQLASTYEQNVLSAVRLVQAFVPYMKERGWGRIINVSSLAAFSPPAASLLYTGIKSYVLNISESLDMELKPYGIHVTALCPGFTHSEFHDVMGTRDTANHLPAILWQQPDAVVKEAYEAVMKGKPVCVPGIVNKVIASSMRPMPESARYFLGKTFNPFKN